MPTEYNGKKTEWKRWKILGIIIELFAGTNKPTGRYKPHSNAPIILQEDPQQLLRRAQMMRQNTMPHAA